MAYCCSSWVSNPCKTLDIQRHRDRVLSPSNPNPASINWPAFKFNTKLGATYAMSAPHPHQSHPSIPQIHPNHQLFQAIKASLSNCLSETNLHLTVPGLHSKTTGKVRDIYDAGDYIVLVTTDRQSAFDRVLASIPFKGQVLNQTSLWWFNQTHHITPNAVLSAPDGNVTIAKKCDIFPVEFVVRGFVTGSTDTSLWTVYNKGVRDYCGNALPDGLVKNQRLERNILTPTTKAAEHDVPVTPDEGK